MAYGFVVVAGSGGSSADVAVNNHNSSANAHSQIFTEINRKISEVEVKADTAANKANNAASVNFTRTLNSGTKIGTITINGVDTELYSEKNTDTVYTHPATAGNKHIPAGGALGQILKWSSEGTAEWGNYSNATTTESGLMSAADKEKLDSGYVVKHDSGGYYVEV